MRLTTRARHFTGMDYFRKPHRGWTESLACNSALSLQARPSPIDSKPICMEVAGTTGENTDQTSDYVTDTIADTTVVSMRADSLAL